MASDPDDKDYSAIHGNFIPLQSPEGLFLIPPRHPRSPRRLRSRSPQRRRQEPGVHLHLSLTDSQMDTLTSTLAKDDAATRPHRRAGPDATAHARSASPGRASPDARSGERLPATTYVDPTAEEPGMTDASSSVYSMDDLARVLPHIHPLYVQKIAAMGSPGRSPGSPGRSPGSPGRSPGPSPEQATFEPVHNQDPDRDTDPDPSPVYPPLDPAWARKGHKVLVGHNGWLERTGRPDPGTAPPGKPVSSSGGGLLDTLKRMAKATESRVRGSGEASTMAAAGTPTRTASTRAAAARTLRISLDPREQSLLYGELEFLLTGALDAFLDAQFHAGRLDAAQYKRVVDAWLRQGRPRVVGFRYDLETQLDLVQRHAPGHGHSSDLTFAFHGPRAADPVAAAALLASMKVNARALRIRTFCQPDSAVAKQLLDSQALLELLGADAGRQIQLAEVVQFFKIVLEREQAGREGAREGVRTAAARADDGTTPPRLRPSRTAHALEHVATPPRAATQRGR